MSESETSVHLRRAWSGEETSVEWLMARYDSVLVTFTKQKMSAQLQRHFEPEELVNTTWVRFLRWARQRPVQEDARPLVKQLLKISLNVVLDHARKLGRSPRIVDLPVLDAEAQPDMDALAGTVTSVSHALRQSEGQRACRTFLENLAPDERTILVEAILSDRGDEDLASLLTTSVDAAKKRRQRLLARLEQAPPLLLRALRDGFGMA